MSGTAKERRGQASAKLGLALMALGFGWTTGAQIGCQHRADAPAVASKDATFARITWRQGQRYLYTARLQSRTALGESPADAGNPTVDLTADVEVTPLRVEGGTAELLVVLQKPRLGTEEAPGAADLARELSTPVVVTLSHGKLTEQRFVPGLSPLAVAILRMVTAGYQLADAPSGQQKWTATEHDATGDYEAEYQLVGPAGHVNKRKLGFKSSLVSGVIDAASRARLLPTVARSTGELQLSEGQLRSVKLADRVESQLLQKQRVSVDTQLDLQLQKGFPMAATAPDRAELLRKTVQVAVDQPYGNAQATQRFDELRIGGRTFEQVLSELERQAKDPNRSKLWGAENEADVSEAERAERELRLGQRVNAFSSMVAIVRQKPETIALAMKHVRRGSPAAKVLMDALAMAGSPEAQAGLLTLVTDANLPKQLRVSGATSLIRVKEPSPPTVSALKALLSDPLLGQHAAYGLGIAARHLREAKQHEASLELSNTLVDLLRAAKTPAEQVRCLRGVANSAYVGALDAVRPLLTAPDFEVRSAAVEALRLMADARADAAIAERATTDADARVRLSAIRSSVRRTPTDLLRAALSKAAESDVNDTVRQEATRVLAGWSRDHADLRAVLQKIAKADANRLVRELAQSSLDKADTKADATAVTSAVR